MPKTQPKPDRTQQELSAIHALRENPRTPEALAQLRRALADKSNFVVAAAAEVVAAAELVELLPLLREAFARFMISPEKSDKGCKAKLAIADALYRNESQDEALFRSGLHHRQMEPIWGGRQDTAAELRGLCALALAQIGLPGVIEDLAELLADPEVTTRALCLRALGASGREEALPLLRYKLRIGDEAGEVMLECCAALLSLAPRRALPVLAQVLEQADDARSEAAALALGQSRHEDALPLLQAFAQRRPVPDRRVALVAIAMLRSPAAISHLVDLVATAPLSLATQAVRALAVHRYDAALLARVREAAQVRDEAALVGECEEAFAGR